MYGKINRIGNSELQLSNRETDISNLYNVGDYTDDTYIITEKEVIFYKDYVYANYGLSRNFNKISSFIGVNSEIRQWEIGEQNTLDRNLMYKEHIEIDIVESGNGSDTSQLMQSDGIEVYMDTLKSSSTKEPVRGGMFTSSDSPQTVFASLSSNGGGNSLIFDWKFINNVSVDNFVETVASQDANNFAKYTADDGLLTSFTLYMFSELNQGDTTLADYYSTGKDYPKTNLSYISDILVKNDTVFIANKDSREVIGGTIHLQQR